MKRIWVVIALLCSLLVLASCGGGGGGSGDDDSSSTSSLDNFVAMNIGDAKSLFITPAGSSYPSSKLKLASKSSDNSSTDYLFKITTSGDIEKVDFLDKDKSELSLGVYHHQGDWYEGYFPVMIKNINNSHFVIGFSSQPLTESNSTPWIEYAYLVRKTDGAVYKLKDVPSSNIKTDSYNNAYYIASFNYGNSCRIVRVNLDLMSREIISPSTDRVEEFEVDDSGNLLYKGSANNYGLQVYRVMKRTGNLSNMRDANQNYPFWKAPDGKLYYYDYYYTDAPMYITKYSVKNINPTTGDFEDYGTFASDWGVYSSYNLNKIAVSKSGVNYFYLVDGDGHIDEVYNSSDNTPKKVSVSGMSITKITSINSTDNYMYIAGKDNSSNNFLVRVTPGGTSLAYDSILGNEYEVYSFTVSEEDGITFNALRMADGKKVIGKISTSGGPVMILDSESDVKISYLERIR